MSKDGMTYAPKGKPNPVVKEGEFSIAAAALDHGHIYGMVNGLLEAGATLKWVYDPDSKKVEEFVEKFPQVAIAESLDQILDDHEVKLVAAAAIPSQRSALGNRVMESGKDYFTDKTPFTTMAQLEETKRVVKKTGKKYMVYFSERLHVEGAVFAGQLIKDGAIGRVIQVTGFGPHRLNAESRPDWFFDKEQYGGILCDIGSHQIEQFLYYAGVKMRRFCTVKSAITIIRTILGSRITEMPRCLEIMVPLKFSKSIGLRLTDCGHGVMAALSSPEQKVPSKFANIWMWRVKKRVITYILLTRMAKSITVFQGLWAIRFSGNSSKTVSIALRML